jgi:glycine/D-amino acid oxidase-like deaminating enzyme
LSESALDTLIIGNGIIGLSTALRLCQRAGAQDKIVVVGKRERPGCATLAAAAMMNCFAEVEAGSLDSELERYRFEVSRNAAKRWPDFARELETAAGAAPKTQDAGLYHGGTYIINNTSADDRDEIAFDAIVDALKTYDEPFTFVDPKEVPNYAPEQRYRALRAMHIPNEGWLNPRRMVSLIEHALKTFPNFSFVDDEVERIHATAKEITSVTTRGGVSLSADKYLLASGATSTDLLAASEIDLGIQRIFYGVGVSIQLSSPDFPHKECVRTPNRGLACGLYTVPFLDGSDRPQDNILIGATNFISPVPQQYGRLTSVETLMRGAIEQINHNFYKANLVGVNVGWRPTSQDTLPLIGPTRLSNLVVATGTKRDGLHLSPVISEIIAAMLRGEAVDPRFAAFAPDRKPLRLLTREKAIAKTVRHQINASYQHGFVPAHGPMRKQLEASLRDNLEKLHDQVGAKDWGIPPEMIDMYRYGHARMS